MNKEFAVLSITRKHIAEFVGEENAKSLTDKEMEWLASNICWALPKDIRDEYCLLLEHFEYVCKEEDSRLSEVAKKIKNWKSKTIKDKTGEQN